MGIVFNFDLGYIIIEQNDREHLMRIQYQLTILKLYYSLSSIPVPSLSFSLAVPSVFSLRIFLRKSFAKWTVCVIVVIILIFRDGLYMDVEK